MSKGGNSVKVALRVRPFNSREKGLKAKLCVEMVGTQTCIWDLDSHGGDKEKAYKKKRKFNFDYSFWSFKSEDPHFIDNKRIFNFMGKEILNQCWDGYNVSLFAYGQTGAGKSYSMIGYGEDKGIVPLSCTEIFRRINAKKKEYEEKNVEEVDQIEYLCQASMIEIYNEKVKDLFNHKNNPPGGLKVREHPKTGPYVVGLTYVTCKSAEEILKWLDIGNKNKTIGETKMNKTSSRAHTLFTVYLKFTSTRKYSNGKVKKIDVTSKLNLVDLAGSEKLKNTGNTGARMKEGININKSLSALGNCIKALADKSEGKKIHIPFRDSVLTKIMKESLGGNSKTIMIAAISPGSSNYTETLSTLRYADRAKKIKTKATRNEDEREKKIRLLTAEVERLKKLLGEKGIVNLSEDMRDQLIERTNLISQMTESEEDRDKRTNALQQQNLENFKNKGLSMNYDRKKDPHIVNLNEDPFMDSQLVYPLLDEIVTLGKSGASPSPKIPLDGLGIQPLHCTFELIDSKGNKGEKNVYIKPGEDIEKCETFLNGEKLKKSHILSTGDRIVIGSSHIFKFVNPIEYIRLKKLGKLKTNTNMDWTQAKEELAKRQNQELLEEQKKVMEVQMKKLELEMKEKKKKAEEKLQKEKEALKTMNDDMIKKMEEMKKNVAQEERKKIEEALQRQKEEFEKKTKEMEEKLQKEKEKAQQKLQQEIKENQIRDNDIKKLSPMVKECNYITEEMGYPQVFELKIIKDNFEKTKVVVLAKNTKKGLSNLWEQDKFIDRMYKMKECYEDFVTCMENDIAYKPSEDFQKGDPFRVVEAGEPQLIGTAVLYLKSLCNYMGTSLFTSIMDYKGKVEGELKAEIVPCFENWKEDKDDELFVGDKSELLNEMIYFKIKIPHARGLSKKRCSDSFFKFQIPLSDEWVISDVYAKDSINPEFDFERKISLLVSNEFLEFIQDEFMKIHVFASQKSSYVNNSKDGGDKALIKRKNKTEQYKEELEEVREVNEKLSEKLKYIDQEKEESDRKILLLNDEIEELKRMKYSSGKNGEEDYKKFKELEEEIKMWKSKYEEMGGSGSNDEESRRLNSDNERLKALVKKLTEEKEKNENVKGDKELLKQISELKKSLEEEKKKTENMGKGFEEPVPLKGKKNPAPTNPKKSGACSIQ